MDWQEVENLLIQRNQAHFSQAAGTPFTVALLLDIIDPPASQAMNDEVLQSIVDNPSSSLEVKEIIRYLMDHSKPTIPMKFTMKEIQQAYCTWNCDMTRSPLGHQLDN